MATDLSRVQPLLAFAARHLDEDLSLTTLARKSGLSPFHLHRVFSAAAGETPKEFTLRLRLDRAAVLLLTTNDSVLDVAIACGFASHEVFCRAFGRQFGMRPRAYRARGFEGDPATSQKQEHIAAVARTGPCLRFFRTTPDRETMPYSITRKEIAPQPVLVVERRVKPSEIAATLAEVLGLVFQHGQRAGVAFAGQPFTRYMDWGPGMLTIQAGLPIATPGTGEGEVRAETLPGGPVATTIHSGAYDKLTEAHAALQVWIEEQGFRSAGTPWEVYVTDPADYPDPADWKTEIFWPVHHY
jgi:AraC-like DNA-binding protein/effector-binding domain-containing protein